jgi:hypothetical protein
VALNSFELVSTMAPLSGARRFLVKRDIVVPLSTVSGYFTRSGPLFPCTVAAKAFNYGTAHQFAIFYS